MKYIRMTASGDSTVSQEPTKFAMLAYTGGLINLEGWDAPVIIDLEGVVPVSEKIPLRLDHDPWRVVGHVEKLVIENGQIIAEGVISRANDDAKDVAISGANGFPWQCSIGGPAVEYLELGVGESLEVNGQTVEGPCYVVTKFELCEISFVALGADGNTSAVKAAKLEEVEIMPEEKKIEAASLDDSVRDYREKMAEEVKRVSAIRALSAGRHADIEAQAIAEGWTAERAELEMLRASRPTVPEPRKVEAEDSKVLEAAALMAAGIGTKRLEASYKEETLDHAYKMRGIGLRELCARACGKDMPRFRSDASGWLHAAFSTANVGGLLSNIANKSLLDAYESADESWRQVAKIASVNDFKTHTRYRLVDGGDFEKVLPGGEIKNGTLEEQSFTNKADTYGIMFSITRQMLIDDDLGAFADIPRRIGVKAGEAIAEAVWSLLLSNPGSFFSAGNGNLLTGTTSALDIASLGAADAAFAAQTKPNGKPIGIPAATIVVPPQLYAKARAIVTSTLVNNGATKATPNKNIYEGVFDVVRSPYLSNSSYSGYSATAWYLIADPNKLAGMEVAFLNGVDRPTVEQAEADFNTLGIRFRGYIDFGVAMMDYRAMVKSTGTN